MHIDLDAVAANWAALDQLSGPNTQTAAVIKADGYGLGAGRVARRLAENGVRRFFVAVAEEGIAVREALGPGPAICVFSGHMDGDTELLDQLAMTPMLNSIEQLTRHLEALPGHRFGVQLDTGMNRLGMEPAEWAAVSDLVLQANPDLIMSHLACADEPDHPQNAEQLAAFRRMTDGLNVRRSLSATGGILLGKDYHFDLTRPGVGLYGGEPFVNATPVIRLSLPVVQTRDLEPGETVGYSATFVADKPTRIATVSGGYADGLLRSQSGKGQLFAGDIACPIAGRVSMDLISVDVTHLNEVPDYLDIVCPAQGVDDVAGHAGTIGYEILTSLGARYDRTYVGGKA
ncbi:alanine racemase [Actibacterium pelagium]|uniref:Alanine racemase n=1 Tax=Actibacterium pelagium TaxID=2029103 RepID=A0A917EIS8_9RHOB|nr:alanine racemase [Actibacterium pelagium]